MQKDFRTAAGESAMPIHGQIYERLRRQIEEGYLKPGQRVISLRNLAVELGVARGTVEAAYGRLIGDGFLESRGAAGTFVASTVALKAPGSAMPEGTVSSGPARGGGTGSSGPLALGLPALNDFPRKLWGRLLARRANDADLLGRPDPRGYAPLREAIAGYLQRSRGVACAPAQVFIVPGYAAALNLAAQVLLRRDDSVWVENPGYPPTHRLLRNLGMVPVAVPVDEEGMVVEAGLQRSPGSRMAVVTPSHQSPTGATLSLQRRTELLQWAAQNGAWIVEDDYDGEYRYQGPPLPALKSLDRQDRVVYTGTFSKVLFAGIRLAYCVVPARKIPEFEEACAEVASGACPVLMQKVVFDFLEQGHFARHIKKMRSLYAKRRQYLADALLALGPDRIDVRLQAGGMHLLARPRVPATDAQLAAAPPLGYRSHALSSWGVDGPGPQGLILGFTNLASREHAEQVVRELEAAWFHPRRRGTPGTRPG